MLQLTPLQIENFPVSHLSNSSIREYMSDRQLFAKKYIRGEFDIKTGPSAIEGKIFHKVLEIYYSELKKGNPTESLQNILPIALDEIEKEFENVDRGKTGSAEKSITTIKQCLKFYENEMLPRQKIDEIVDTESTIISNFTSLDDPYIQFPIPLKGVIDLIYLDNGTNLIIEDHKVVTEIVSEDEPNGGYELQAGVYFFIVKEKYGVEPSKMIFRQIKKSKNRDGSPQVVPYTIVYDRKILMRFIELYSRIVKELAGLPLFDIETGSIQYIPNPFAFFGGKDSRDDFCKEVDENIKRNINDIKKSPNDNLALDDF